MSKYDSDEFKALQKEWYKKLATTPNTDGEVFKDIEDTNRADQPLKAWHDSRFKTISITQRLTAESYYEQATQLLHTYKFKNPTHRRIWELHCEGVSRRKIAFQIKDMKPTYKHIRVTYIIQEISKAIKGAPSESNHS